MSSRGATRKIISGNAVSYLSGLLGLLGLFLLPALSACRSEPDPVMVLQETAAAQATQITALIQAEQNVEVAAAAIQLNVTALQTRSAGLATQSAQLAARSEAQATQGARQAADIQAQGTIISHLATRGPAPAGVEPGSTPTPYRPVIGSVVLDGGACCAGGVAGEIIELEAAFEAESPLGEEVTELRARLGTAPFSEEEFREDEWGPFVEALYYPIELAVNWTGYHVSVQFRDAAGNLSPVYYDEIAVEGLP